MTANRTGSGRRNAELVTHDIHGCLIISKHTDSALDIVNQFKVTTQCFMDRIYIMASRGYLDWPVGSMARHV
jgi:hypothetical protein